jgi:hypothetical protein
MKDGQDGVVESQPESNGRAGPSFLTGESTVYTTLFSLPVPKSPVAQWLDSELVLAFTKQP